MRNILTEKTDFISEYSTYAGKSNAGLVWKTLKDSGIENIDSFHHGTINAMIENINVLNTVKLLNEFKENIKIQDKQYKQSLIISTCAFIVALITSIDTICYYLNLLFKWLF